MLINVNNLSYRYKKTSPWILKDVSLSINQGERVGILGPSGCGKSTLAKIIAGYIDPVSGEVTYDNQPIDKKGYCPIQMIHQHPELAVNPRRKMSKILTEGWDVDQELMQNIGIEEEWLKRWPNELSGGELQRFCIARVLSSDTKLLICDEITTMLDVITQAQIWNLLLDISQKRKLSMLIITHNTSLASKVCTRTIRLSDINHTEEKDCQKELCN